jgi:TPR repeat protein
MTLTHGRQRGSQVPARNAANLKAQWRLAYIYEHGELGLEVESAKALEYLFKNQKSIKNQDQKSKIKPNG